MSKISNFKLSIFSKLLFRLKKPKIIVVAENNRQSLKKTIYQVLKNHFNIGKEVLIFEIDLKNPTNIKKLKFLMENSSLPVLIITHIGDISANKEVFDGDKKDSVKDFSLNKEKIIDIEKIAKTLPSNSYLILNFDEENIRETIGVANFKTLTFGFRQGADIRATDINLEKGINFKIDYKGSIVPVWLTSESENSEKSDKEQIYSALSAIAVGLILDLNLVEISQAFKK